MLKYILDTDMVIYTMKSRTCGLMIAGHVRSLGGILLRTIPENSRALTGCAG